MTERFRPFAAVYGLLIRGGDIFMVRRKGTGWLDGYYGLPSGHMDGAESVTSAARREVKEEVGVVVGPGDFKVVHVMHRIRLGDREYIDFFLATDTWEGEPHNAEPEKCDDAAWYPVSALPENTIPSVRSAIEGYLKGIFFSEFGWDGMV